MSIPSHPSERHEFDKLLADKDFLHLHGYFSTVYNYADYFTMPQ